MPGDTPSPPVLGARLRAMRTERGHTLKAVAGPTGISASFLSLVETGRSDITFGRLRRLLEFYGATFSDLVPEDAPPEPMIVRAGERRSVPSPGEGLELFLLTHGDGHAMAPVLVEYGRGAELHEYRGGSAEVFVHLIEGELEFELEGRRTFSLAPGDSAYYEADVLRVRNTGPGVARLLAVGSADAPGR